MGMSKKDFIALADSIREFKVTYNEQPVASRMVDMLADFCRTQNSAFNRKRWLAYIAGECGPNGGEKKGGAR